MELIYNPMDVVVLIVAVIFSVIVFYKLYTLFKRNAIKLYCSIYDSYYNDQQEWIEQVCYDRHCKYCRYRPNTHPKDCACGVK